jgi:hypothetical protein
MFCNVLFFNSVLFQNVPPCYVPMCNVPFFKPIFCYCTVHCTVAYQNRFKYLKFYYFISIAPPPRPTNIQPLQKIIKLTRDQTFQGTHHIRDQRSIRNDRTGTSRTRAHETGTYHHSTGSGKFIRAPDTIVAGLLLIPN